MTAAGRHSQPLFHIRCTRLWRPWFPVYDVHHICISNYTAMAARMSRDFSLFQKIFLKIGLGLQHLFLSLLLHPLIALHPPAINYNIFGNPIAGPSFFH